MRISLKLRAAAAITLVFLAMMALIATVQSRFIRADLVDAVTVQQLDLVRAAADELDLHLQTNLRALTQEALAIPPEILAKPQLFQAYLERQPRGKPSGSCFAKYFPPCALTAISRNTRR